MKTLLLLLQLGNLVLLFSILVLLLQDITFEDIHFYPCCSQLLEFLFFLALFILILNIDLGLVKLGRHMVLMGCDIYRRSNLLQILLRVFFIIWRKLISIFRPLAYHFIIIWLNYSHWAFILTGAIIFSFFAVIIIINWVFLDGFHVNTSIVSFVACRFCSSHFGLCLLHLDAEFLLELASLLSWINAFVTHTVEGCVYIELSMLLFVSIHLCTQAFLELFIFALQSIFTLLFSLGINSWKNLVNFFTFCFNQTLM